MTDSLADWGSPNDEYDIVDQLRREAPEHEPTLPPRLTKRQRRFRVHQNGRIARENGRPGRDLPRGYSRSKEGGGKRPELPDCTRFGVGYSLDADV